MPTLQASQLTDAGLRIFRAAGVPEQEAQTVARHLVTANLVGHDSHGVIRIPQYVDAIRNGELVPGAPFEVLKETPSTAVVAGNWGFGQVVAARAMELAIDKARACGLSGVGVRHSHHIGRLGEYVEMAVDAGLIGFVFVNCHGASRWLAPWGGTERRMSVNPLAIGIPGSDGHHLTPVILDISSSVVAEGKVRVRRNTGQPVPEGWVQDSSGRSTTDPNGLYGPPPGSLLPFGGHKGYGLAVVVDILAGGLSGGGMSRENPPHFGNAVFILVIDPGCFVPVEELRTSVRDFARYIKSSAKRPGVDEILLPYEPEMREKARRTAEGITVDEGTWSQITRVAGELGVEAEP